MNWIIVTLVNLLWLAEPTNPQPEDAPDAAALSMTFAQLAADADLIAVVQVEETTYEYVRRKFPVKGTGYLKVLLPYKGDTTPGTLIQVPESGLRDTACYYPRLDLFQVEGARFLAFLKQEKDDVYKGVAPYCQLPVFVTDSARYALKYPVPGVEFASPDQVRELQFADPAAYVETNDMTRMQIEALEADFARPVPTAPGFPPDTRYVYTRGIMLGDVRAAMFPPERTAATP